MARVCIDGFNLAMPKGSGIATYARGLHSSLAELGHETQILFSSTRDASAVNLMNQVALLDAVTPRRRMLGWLPPLRPVAWPIDLTGDVITRELSRRFPAADRVWASRNIFHAANRAYAAFGRFTPIRLGPDVQTDLMHWTTALPIHEPRIANVYTIYDLVPLRLPFATMDNKRKFFLMCRRLVARADRIVTVSDHSRGDIIRLLGAREDQVVNTHQAVELPDHLLQRSDEDVALDVEAMFDLPWRGYYIFFGAVEPKKNLPRIVEAYLASGVVAPLVIVGGGGWLSEDQTSLLYDDITQASILRDGILRRSDRVRRYDHLPFRLLISLIRGARATLFPSLYEGFGLPVLESMLLGAPVLTSTEGSLPEIAGDAALLVDPYDVDAIRQGIRALDADPDLRDELAARGRRQAAKFNRERYKRRLEDVYRPLL